MLNLLQRNRPGLGNIMIHTIFDDGYFILGNATPNSSFCSGRANGYDVVIFIETGKDLFLEISHWKHHIQPMQGNHSFQMLIARMKEGKRGNESVIKMDQLNIRMEFQYSYDIAIEVPEKLQQTFFPFPINQHMDLSLGMLAKVVDQFKALFFHTACCGWIFMTNK